MDELKIESGIPVTPRRRGVGKNQLIAMKMKVGDSVLTRPAGNNSRMSNLYTALTRLGYKATCRREGDMVRTWRIE